MTDIEKLYKFMDNMNFKENHVSNVYVAKTYTSDGICTSEHYGMNLMTDYGFAQYFANDTDVTFPTNLYVGQGTSSFDKTTSTLISLLWNGLAATVVDTNINHTYPLYYAAGDQTDNGRMTTVSRYLICRYAQNISGVTNDVVISEYGIGSSPTNLWTHSFVYDLTGARASIIKHPNEILEITVYFCCTIREDVLINARDNGVYPVITTGHLMMNRMKLPNVYTYQRTDYNDANGKYARTILNSSRTAIVDSSVTRTITLNDVILDFTDSQRANKYIDGFAAGTTGCTIIQPQLLDEAEEFETAPFVTYDYKNPEGFARRLGVDILFTQLETVEATMYNMNTSSWEPVLCFSSPNHQHGETPMSTAFATLMYYTNNDQIETLYVYQNLNTADPIVEIQGSVGTLYATDKYWKGLNIPNNDWIYISDRTNIPEAAQHKRYWISNSNSINLNPLRGIKDFQLELSEGDSGYATTPSNWGYNITATNRPGQVLYNTEYKWALTWQTNDVTYCEMFGLDANFHKLLSEVGGVDYAYTYGKWLLLVRSASNTLYIYDTSTVPSGTLAAPTSMVYDTAMGSNDAFAPTDSSTGILTIATTTGNTHIFDFRGNTVVQKTLSGCAWGTCLWNTHKVAYVSTDKTTIEILDVDTNTVVQSISLGNITNVFRLFAHTNYLWISTSDEVTYLCDVRTNEISEYPTHLKHPYSYTAGPYIKCTADFIMFYSTNGTGVPSNIGFIAGIDINNINVVKTITNSMITDYNGDYEYCFGSNVFPAGNTLIGMTIGYKTDRNPHPPYLTFFDFGRFMRTGEFMYISTKDKEDPSLNIIYDKWYINGTKMIPLIDLLPIKLSGTTRTISALDGQKRIYQKNFELTYSNKTVFSGKPPGSSN